MTDQGSLTERVCSLNDRPKGKKSGGPGRSLFTEYVRVKYVEIEALRDEGYSWAQIATGVRDDLQAQCAAHNCNDKTSHEHFMRHQWGREHCSAERLQIRFSHERRRRGSNRPSITSDGYTGTQDDHRDWDVAYQEGMP